MQEWSESVYIAIEVLLFSVIIGIALTFGHMGRDLMNANYEDRRATESMQEYRVYNQYDEKEVYSQDIVTLIFENRGNPGVKVNMKTGTVLQWTTTTKSTEYLSDDITGVLNINSVYKATLERDANGVVTTFLFAEM